MGRVKEALLPEGASYNASKDEELMVAGLHAQCLLAELQPLAEMLSDRIWRNKFYATPIGIDDVDYVANELKRIIRQFS